MAVGRSRLPTQDAEALRSFVSGRELFQAYWGSRALPDLRDAKHQFEQAEQSDPGFALASFYVAVVYNELREHDSAIAKLQSLAERQVDFLPEAYVHLAYAYTKRYTDQDYNRAEEALDRAAQEARKRRRFAFLAVVESYRVFLYSVIGGRSKRQNREKYLEKAIKRGRRLLLLLTVLRLEGRLGVLIEIHNALGIAYMRQGQQTADRAKRKRLWRRSDEEYEQALQVNPNVVRALQNRGSLRELEGDDALASDPTVARQLYEQARELFLHTLAINPNDQFPHYRVAILCAKLGDWQRAQQYHDSGLREPGSVKAREWDRVRQAIQTGDPSGLAWRPDEAQVGFPSRPVHE